MTIRYLITNAFGGGGTIRATINIANELARSHDVEIVSVLRRADASKFRIDPSVRLRVLTDRSPAATDRRSRHTVVSRRLAAWSSQQPSRLIHSDERRYGRFSLLTDAHLLRFLRSVRDGVLVSTRPGLNLAVARFVRPSVIRIAQEHINLAHHRRMRPELVEELRTAYQRFDAVTTLTAEDAEDYDRLLGRHVPVLDIPNAVPALGVRADPSSHVVIAAGRLTRAKGFNRLIRAFAGVVAKRPDWQLRIFGEGDQKAKLETQIKRLGLRGHVRLGGFSTDLPREMAAASVLAMSSRFEGFPMVLLEAMACGLPVVSFDCPTGPRSIIDDGTNGLLVANGDVGALTAGLLELIEHDDRRAAMAAAALETAAQFSVEVTARRWLDLFSQLDAARGSITRRSARRRGPSEPSEHPRDLTHR